MNNIKYFDLFSGIGGFHQAMKEIKIDNLSFEHIGYCEIDKQARLFYEEAHKIKDSIEIEDATNIKTKETGSIELKPFDLLFAGFPCQSFSNIGYRKGLNDERGKLFYTILNLLEYYKPKYFILENVQKISTIKKGSLISEMKDALENISDGYHLHLWDLNAKNYGVPQNRRRMFFCGVRADLFDKRELNVPPEIDLKTCKYPTTWHLLEKNNKDTRHIIPEKTRKTVLYKNDKWQGNVDIDNLIARPITASMHKWHRANQDNYFSEHYINSDIPTSNNSVCLENDIIRRITPLEGFRLQGFPDYFESIAKQLNLSYSCQYRLIGNSVPVSMVKSVLNHFFNNYKEN